MPELDAGAAGVGEAGLAGSGRLDRPEACRATSAAAPLSPKRRRLGARGGANPRSETMYRGDPCRRAASPASAWRPCPMPSLPRGGPGRDALRQLLPDRVRGRRLHGGLSRSPGQRSLADDGRIDEKKRKPALDRGRLPRRHSGCRANSSWCRGTVRQMRRYDCASAHA